MIKSIDKKITNNFSFMSNQSSPGTSVIGKNDQSGETSEAIEIAKEVSLKVI